MSFLHRLGAGHDKQMVRPTDLCHQWCHKFIILISLVELFHTVEAATVEAFDSGIFFYNIGGNIINDFITKRSTCA